MIRFALACAALAALLASGCHDEEDETAPILAPVKEAGTGPALTNKHTPNCLQGWPSTPFSSANKTGWFTSLSAGKRAVAFTLKDTAGKAYSLADLLKKGPVWLQLGSYT
jgi:hypothetical protein